MKRLSLVLLAVAFVAAGAAGCFKDPVSGLRSGPTIVNLDHSSIYVAVGDSTTVTATVQDNGGNVLPETDATWTSSDPTIAVVRKDTTQVIPGNYFTRAFIRGVLPTGGVTTVTIVTRGLTATVRVVVTPPLIPHSQVSSTGTASTDTVIIPAQVGPPAVPVQTVIYSASDTLVINGTSFLNFDTSKVAVTVTGPGGKFPGYVFAKTPTQIKVVFLTGASGRVWVKGLVMVGPAAVGTPTIDSLLTSDSVLLSRIRYKGGYTQAGDTVTVASAGGFRLGPNTIVHLGTGTGVVFDTIGSRMLIPANYTGAVTFDTIRFGMATLTPNMPGGTATGLVASTYGFPGTVTQVGDTMTLTTAGRVRFDALTRATVGGVKDSVIAFDSLHLYLLAPTTSTGALSVSNTKLQIVRLTLTSAGPYTTTTATVPASTISQAGDTLTLTGNAKMTVDSSTTIAFGATAATTLSFGTNSMSVILGAATYTGVVTVKNAKVGLARIASLKTTGSYTMNQAKFLGTIAQAGDTMTITAPSNMTFDASTGAAFGASTAIILSRSATALRVLSVVAYTGPVTVTNGLLGAVRVPAMATTASYTVTQVQFLGTITQLGDTMTVTAPSYITFDAQTSVAFGAGNAAIILSGNATTLKVLSPVAYTGPVSVTNPLLGTLRVPAMITPASYTMNAASFPNANVSVGAGRLGDTIIVTAPTGYTFDTLAGKLSMVLAGNLAISTSDTAWILSRTSTTIKAFAKRGGVGPVRVTNVIIPGPVVVPYLTTPANFPIDSVASDFPLAMTFGTARSITIDTTNTSAKPVVVYGTVSVANNADDYWTFTTTAARKISVSAQWFGSGNPGGTGTSTPAYTSDLDMLVCNVGNQSGCNDGEAADLLGYAAAGASNPEKGTSASLPAAQYWVDVIPYTTGGYTVLYRLTVSLDQ